MVAPLSGQVQRLPRLNVSEAADDGDRLWRTRHLEAGHGVARFGEVKGQPVNDALEVVSGLLAHVGDCQT